MKAVFLDRDGVINIDYGYVYEIDKLEFIPRAVEGLKLLQEAGFKLIIITSQSGIGRGYYKEEDYHHFMKHMYKKLEEQDVKIDADYFCPHAPEANCNCRKPKKALFEKAVKEHDIALKESYLIGDKTSDIKAGENIGCKTILVKTGKGGNDKRFEVKPDFIAKDLYEAAEWIVGR